MRQDELRPAPGSRKNRKRVGRGDGSGHGTFSGRGIKGQKARSGGQRKSGFEGGQTPMILRLPKRRGFFNRFKKDYSVVNIEQLNVFKSGSDVTVEELAELGLVNSRSRPLKVLGDGELKVALTVKAARFSAVAKTKIEAAGGKAEEIGNEVKAD